MLANHCSIGFPTISVTATTAAITTNEEINTGPLALIPKKVRWSLLLKGWDKTCRLSVSFEFLCRS
jgi:hypothetical protein